MFLGCLSIRVNPLGFTLDFGFVDVVCCYRLGFDFGLSGRYWSRWFFDFRINFGIAGFIVLIGTLGLT